MIAAILIRGTIHSQGSIKDTLKMLNLHRKHACVILEDSDSVRGMLKKAQNYLAYGTITKETLELLKKVRSSKENVYHLNPPRGGFERKGIKVSYQVGGALGDRGKDMNELIKRMLP